MAKRGIHVEARCEDLQQRVFLYRALVEKGVGNRDISIRNCPRGRGGDAKAWVRGEHAKAVGQLRATPHRQFAVVTTMDADGGAVDDRKVELDSALIAAGQPKRAPGERIAILAPKRSIETWLHWGLSTGKVDETIEYPRFRGDERQCQPAVRRFVDRCPGRFIADDPPSLVDACDELLRAIASPAE